MHIKANHQENQTIRNDVGNNVKVRLTEDSDDDNVDVSEPQNDCNELLVALKDQGYEEEHIDIKEEISNTIADPLYMN